jgi:hypothetical protein
MARHGGRQRDADVAFLVPIRLYPGVMRISSYNLVVDGRDADGKGGAADFWQVQLALGGRVERDWRLHHVRR